MTQQIAPAILLDRPQMGENIGSVARAMANFGLSDLRLIAPRDGWPNPAAEPISSGAFEAGVQVRVFENFMAASADLHCFLAATARVRSLTQPVHDASGAVERLVAMQAPTGIVFGPENSGLDNEIISLSAGIMRFPTQAEFSSLNLAHAVVVFCHQWAARPEATKDRVEPYPVPASREDLFAMLAHLEQELERQGWFFPEHKRPAMQQNLRSAFARAGWTSQEVRSFRGVIRALTDRKEA